MHSNKQQLFKNPIVVSVHNNYMSALKEANSLYPKYKIIGNIKESTTGYGYVVYTYDQSFKKIVKYDLSHMY